MGIRTVPMTKEERKAAEKARRARERDRLEAAKKAASDKLAGRADQRSYWERQIKLNDGGKEHAANKVAGNTPDQRQAVKPQGGAAAFDEAIRHTGRRRDTEPRPPVLADIPKISDAPEYISDIRAYLRAEVDKVGGVAGWAQNHDLNYEVVRAAVSGARKPSARMLEILGLEKVAVYRRKA